MAEQLMRPTLYTDDDGYARFRDDPVECDLGSPETMLSQPEAGRAVQFRVSPVGYKSDFHCAASPMYVVVLAGAIELELRDGCRRTFGPGDYFLADDQVPSGATFDATRHGHRSRQVGDEALVTMFIWL